MKTATKYLIRLDDACPTMNWARWERMAALLDAYNIKPIVGVIPDNRDTAFFIDPPRANFWDVISRWRQKDWTIGLHGYQHLYVTQEGGLVPINMKSEFAGLSLQTQEQKIRKGWQIFRSHDLKPTVWIAPGHSFDKNTLFALRSGTEIRTISDGIALNCFMSDGFYWIPQQLWRFRKMPFGTYTICLHPNNMNEQAFQQLERDLENYGSLFISLTDVTLSARAKNPLEKILTELFLFRGKYLRR